MIQKLIDAYELEREMYRKCIDTDEEIEKGRAKWDSGLWIRYKVFEDTITLAPRVDPVKHGHWIEVQRIHEKDHTAICECSLCGDTVWVYDGQRAWNYCPNCGAKMDEAKDGKI